MDIRNSRQEEDKFTIKAKKRQDSDDEADDDGIDFQTFCYCWFYSNKRQSFNKLASVIAALREGDVGTSNRKIVSMNKRAICQSNCCLQIPRNQLAEFIANEHLRHPDPRAPHPQVILKTSEPVPPEHQRLRLKHVVVQLMNDKEGSFMLPIMDLDLCEGHDPKFDDALFGAVVIDDITCRTNAFRSIIAGYPEQSLWTDYSKVQRQSLSDASNSVLKHPEATQIFARLICFTEKGELDECEEIESSRHNSVGGNEAVPWYARAAKGLTTPAPRRRSSTKKPLQKMATDSHLLPKSLPHFADREAAKLGRMNKAESLAQGASMRDIIASQVEGVAIVPLQPWYKKVKDVKNQPATKSSTEHSDEAVPWFKRLAKAKLKEEVDEFKNLYKDTEYMNIGMMKKAPVQSESATVVEINTKTKASFTKCLQVGQGKSGHLNKVLKSMSQKNLSRAASTRALRKDLVRTVSDVVMKQMTRQAYRRESNKSNFSRRFSSDDSRRQSLISGVDEEEVSQLLQKLQKIEMSSIEEAARMLSFTTKCVKSDIMFDSCSSESAATTPQGDVIHSCTLHVNIEDPIQGYLCDPKVFCPLYAHKHTHVSQIRPQITLGFKDDEQGTAELCLIAVTLPKQML